MRLHTVLVNEKPIKGVAERDDLGVIPVGRQVVVREGHVWSPVGWSKFVALDHVVLEHLLCHVTLVQLHEFLQLECRGVGSTDLLQHLLDGRVSRGQNGKWAVSVVDIILGVVLSGACVVRVVRSCTAALPSLPSKPSESSVVLEVAKHRSEVLEVSHLVEGLHQGPVLGVGDMPVVHTIRGQLVLPGASKVQLQVRLERTLAIEERECVTLCYAEVERAGHELGRISGKVLDGALCWQNRLLAAALLLLSENEPGVVSWLVRDSPSFEINSVLAHVLDSDLLPLSSDASVRIDHKVGEGNSRLLVAVDFLHGRLGYDGGIRHVRQYNRIGILLSIPEPWGQACIWINCISSRVFS
mmetsp:Transcript_3199/g.5389  ORF Transcript_3199/g.5389 Transcript_3199/m.5389 type:complete len:356 (+) Transcript_3199:629-1696(+)